MTKKNGSEVIDSKEVYSNRGLIVVEENFRHPSEKGLKNYRYVVMKPSLRIVALTGSQEIVFIEEYKYPNDEYLLSLPAGTVENGENFLMAAKRELEEETGYTSDQFADLGIYYPMAGTIKQEARVVLATNVFECKKENPDAYEKASIRKKELIKLNDIFSEIRSGRLSDGQALTALIMAFAFLKNS